MSTTKTHAITGAYGYSGKYMTQKLLAQGHKVITLTGNPNRPDPFNGQVSVHAFNFEQPEKLVESLRGVDTLFNTYWIRFDHGQATHQLAVENTKILIKAAKQAGVRRMVHVSITNPDRASTTSYFKGKAELEEAVKTSGMSYAILRPAVIFGKEDILINNIAWFLRHLPLFIVPGDGEYQLQPIYVEDLADLAVRVGAGDENQVIDAIGPETFTFKGLVEQIKRKTGSRTLIAHLPAALAYPLIKMMSVVVGDVVLTRDEIIDLMGNRLVTDSPPAGETRLSDWIDQHVETFGGRYANEIKRHYAHE